MKPTPPASLVKRILVLHGSRSVPGSLSVVVILGAHSGGIKETLCAVASAAGAQGPLHPMVERMAGRRGRGGGGAFGRGGWLESARNKTGKVVLRLEIVSASGLL